MQEKASLGKIKFELDDKFDCARLTITDLSKGSMIVLDSDELNKSSETEGIKAEMMLRQFSRKLR